MAVLPIQSQEGQAGIGLPLTMEFCSGVLPPDTWLALASPPGGLVACLLWSAFYFFCYIHDSCNWNMVGLTFYPKGYLQPMNGAVWAHF